MLVDRMTEDTRFVTEPMEVRDGVGVPLNDCPVFLASFESLVL